MSPQLAGVMVVPAGNAGDGLYVTLVAVEVPVLVMVIVLATPLVLSPNELMLELIIVDGGATIILKLLF
jgi:hypothetical protein